MMPDRTDARLDTRHAAGGVRARIVWDAIAGREWRVWATDCKEVPGARSAECLIFDCGTTVRRLWSPPSDWPTLPDGELLSLVEPHRDR